MKEIVIVGAGFYGATLARKLADHGVKVKVYEKANTVAGHCLTEDIDGITTHVFGPHIFHTSDVDIWKFVNRFADFNNFVNRPKVFRDGKVYSFPINLMTLYQVFGSTCPTSARLAVKADIDTASSVLPDSMESWAMQNIGPTLYELFIKHYTTKQWGCSPADLPSSILKRVPIRYTFDDNYFNDTFQGIPIGGYTNLISNMLTHPNITIEYDVSVDTKFVQSLDSNVQVVFTGPIDKFFNFRFGILPYRSLTFNHESLSDSDLFGNAVTNFTGPNVDYTRIIEHKHFDIRRAPLEHTVITTEYSTAYDGKNDPYYPIQNDTSNKLHAKYCDLANMTFPNIHFGGRLGAFKYYDMHNVIAEAFKYFDKLKLIGDI